MAAFRAVSAPVRIIRGSRGMTFDPERAHKRLEALRAGEPVVVEGGHHVHLDAPAEVAREIESFVRGIGPDGLAPGAKGDELVLRSDRGYTGSEPRLQMLQNKAFIDAKVEVFGKHGSNLWVKLGEFKIDRQLLTE
jgi:hypothetical protein